MSAVPTLPRYLGIALGLAALALPLRAAETAIADSAGPKLISPIEEQLRSFRTVATVLYVAAHPDDEDTALITYFARGRGYRTAYLSVTRGDGGQNELGPEFGEKLGLARTYELLAARQLDGGKQFFTRALDFGFTKDVNETLRIWDHQQVLGDVVRVIRTFRPDVVIVGMNPVQTPGQHGQHVASAVLAIEAFKIAGDPKAYPEQFADGLTPWQPKRLVQNQRFGGGRGGAGGAANTVQIEAGGDDPVTGESFAAIAGRSRAMHKTQGFGNFGGGGRGGGGSRMASFAVIGGEPATEDVVDGLDTTFARFPGGADVAKLADDAVAHFDANNPAASVPALLEIRRKLVALGAVKPTAYPDVIKRKPADPVLADKLVQLDRIIQACLGLEVRTEVANAEQTPGGKFTLHTTISLKSAPVPVKWTSISTPSGTTVDSVAPTLEPGQPRTAERQETISPKARVSQPYWLREEATAGMFRVLPEDTKLIGQPINPPAFPVEYSFDVGGQEITVADEPVQVIPDAPPAQQHRKLVVIAPVSLGFPYETEVFTPGVAKQTVVEVTAARGAKGTVQLAVPAGWSVQPASQLFTLANPGDKVSVTFTVTPSAAVSTGRIDASAQVDGARYATERVVFSYPHLPVQLLQPPAILKVAAVNESTRGKVIGYLPGAGDSMAENLEQMGYAVKTLSGADLSPEKLQGVDAVVIGVRAFNERKDLAANLPGLWAYVENGGTVVAQYNRPAGGLPQMGPYPLSIQGNAPQLRVTDENSPVTFVAPEHPALNVPNKITPADFEGWVQERGAYFPSSWDSHYTPILAMSDPGEKQPDSSLLIAQYGKGYYVYTGLAFFRQLPAGVPGAYRLFANLVSLGK